MFRRLQRFRQRRFERGHRHRRARHRAGTHLATTFEATDGVPSATRILCETADGPAALQIKLKSEALGRVPFILKMKTDVAPPPSFLGPIDMRIGDVAISVDGIGSAAFCGAKPTRLSCR